MGTDSNDHLLYSIRNYLLEVSLLGRDDHLSWNVHANGSLVYDHMESKF